MTKTKHVMIVEDSKSMAMMIGAMVEDAGFKMECVHSGEEALRKFGSYMPDLVLLDIEMPGMNGFETLEKLKKEGVMLHHEPPILMLTGMQATKDFVKAKQLGAADYIVKPVEAAILTEKLLKYLKP